MVGYFDRLLEEGFQMLDQVSSHSYMWAKSVSTYSCNTYGSGPVLCDPEAYMVGETTILLVRTM